MKSQLHSHQPILQLFSNFSLVVVGVFKNYSYENHWGIRIDSNEASEIFLYPSLEYSTTSIAITWDIQFWCKCKGKVEKI